MRARTREHAPVRVERQLDLGLHPAPLVRRRGGSRGGPRSTSRGGRASSRRPRPTPRPPAPACPCVPNAPPTSGTIDPDRLGRAVEDVREPGERAGACPAPSDHTVSRRSSSVGSASAPRVSIGTAAERAAHAVARGDDVRGRPRTPPSTSPPACATRSSASADSRGPRPRRAARSRPRPARRGPRPARARRRRTPRDRLAGVARPRRPRASGAARRRARRPSTRLRDTAHAARRGRPGVTTREHAAAAASRGDPDRGDPRDARAGCARTRRAASRPARRCRRGSAARPRRMRSSSRRGSARPIAARTRRGHPQLLAHPVGDQRAHDVRDVAHTWLPSSNSDELAAAAPRPRSASCRSHGISRSSLPVTNSAGASSRSSTPSRSSSRRARAPPPRRDAPDLCANVSRVSDGQVRPRWRRSRTGR